MYVYYWMVRGRRRKEEREKRREILTPRASVKHE